MMIILLSDAWALSVPSTAAACAGRGSVTESCLCPQPLRVLVVGPWLSPVCVLHSHCVCWWWVCDWVLSVSSTAAACAGGGSVTESCPCPPQPLRVLVVGPWLSPVCVLHSHCVCWWWVRDWVLSVSSTAAACAGGGSVTEPCPCPPQPLRVLVVGPWLSPVRVLHSCCVCWSWVRGWALSVSSTAAACAGGGSVTESCPCPPQPLRVLVVGPWLSPVCVHSRCVCWWWVRDWVLSVSSTAAACAGGGSVTESCPCPPQPLRVLVVGPWLSPVCVLHSRCVCWSWVRRASASRQSYASCARTTSCTTYTPRTCWPRPWTRCSGASRAPRRALRRAPRGRGRRRRRRRTRAGHRKTPSWWRRWTTAARRTAGWPTPSSCASCATSCARSRVRTRDSSSTDFRRRWRMPPTHLPVRWRRHDVEPGKRAVGVWKGKDVAIKV